MRAIGTRQMSILDFLYKEMEDKGYPPTVREIGEAVGLASTSTVKGHLDRLEEKGYIERDVAKPRAIQLLKHYNENYKHKHKHKEKDNQKVKRIPIIGKVTAGLPINAIENVEGYLPIAFTNNSNDNLFSLQIMGESMIEAGINDGDLVIVNQQQTANNGDIVVAMTDENEATVKRFYKEDSYFRLQPENKDMGPILLKNVKILGKVVGTYRDVM